MDHDRYDRDILKQLTRIANALEKLNKETLDRFDVMIGAKHTSSILDDFAKECENAKEK